MVALNSQLLSLFGEDLKGNKLNEEEHPAGKKKQSQTNYKQNNTTIIGPKKKSIVGMDHKMLDEMKNLHLKKQDSTKIRVMSGGICDKFRLDTSSAVFGMCKCGHHKNEHVALKKVRKKKLVSILIFFIHFRMQNQVH